MDYNKILCLVTGVSPHPLVEVVAQAVQGGCNMVQLREKDMDTRAMIDEARQLQAVLVGTGVPLIINDRVDVALAVHADGVHLGQSDMDVITARRLLGDKAIIGLSVENMEQVRLSNALPIDYIGISPVFATPTKTNTACPFGLEGTRQAVALSTHPTIGIGGIHLDNVAEVMATGLNGIAVVSEIMNATDPLLAAQSLAAHLSPLNCSSEAASSKLSPLTYKRVLTIAGSDSGGGAGIQADIKAISACGCYAASAITAITAQNTMGVQAVSPVPIDILTGQIAAVVEDIGVDAVKIGMLHSEAVVQAVAQALDQYGITNVVLDPVMVSTSGHRLMEESAVASLQRDLLPQARVITPNIPEAEILLGGVSLQQQSDLPIAAKQLAERYRTSVLLKAGHLSEECLVDILYDRETDQMIELPSVRVHTPNTHGTGCTMSSALAAYLAQGYSLIEAAHKTKDYMNAAIVAGAKYQLGHGHGAVAHFNRWWL